MRRIQKRAYFVTIIILLMFGALVYYSNQQIKNLEVDIDQRIPNFRRDQTEEQPTPPADPPTTEAPVIQPTTPPATNPTPTTPAPKSKSYIITFDQYSINPSSIQVPKGYKISLIFKAGQDLSGKGLRVQMPDQFPVLIGPGQSKTLTFIAESDFVVDVFLESSQTKAPYNLSVTIK